MADSREAGVATAFMASRLEAVRRFRSPYAPSFWAFGARLTDDDRRVCRTPIYVAGKGLSETEARLRLYGEAAERHALALQHDDDTRALIDANFATCGRIAARDVLIGPKQGLGSSGCASHNLAAVAVRSAIAELIERCAVCQWWAQDVLPVALPDDPLVQREVAAIRARAVAPRTTKFLGLRLSGPFKVVLAVSRAPDGTEPAVAFAASSDLARATRRAFLELLSTELETADLHGARLRGETVDRNTARGLVAARQHALTTTHKALLVSQDSAASPASSPITSLGQILEYYAEHGEPIEIVDLTRTDSNLPTYRAVFTIRDQQPRFPGGFDLSPL